MNHNKSLAILTEFSYRIGTGHLLESIELYREAKDNGFKVTLGVSIRSPKSILNRLKVPYIFFRNLNSKPQAKRIKDIFLDHGCSVIVFNFRKITNEILISFKHRHIKTICIDELGSSSLDCDVVINPVIVKKYHKYSLENKNIKIYSGPKYLSLNPNFAKIHSKSRVFKDKICAISVSMGGVDRTDATLRLIDVLAKWRRGVVKNIILGGGCRYAAEARERIKRYPEMNFRLFQNVINIASFFTKSDVVFTAGGNTLYELACCGTPAIVLYEDKHERESGIAFEKKGFGFCLGQGVKVGQAHIIDCLERFQDPQVRYKHYQNGKKIVDGRGAERIVRILSDLAEHSNERFF